MVLTRLVTFVQRYTVRMVLRLAFTPCGTAKDSLRTARRINLNSAILATLKDKLHWICNMDLADRVVEAASTTRRVAPCHKGGKVNIRLNIVSFSAGILTLCLLSLVPASLHWASTWRDLNIALPGISVQNFYMPLGFYSLGIELIGIVVIWTGFVRQQRVAWFVMLIIALLFVVPLNGLKLMLQMHASIITWSDLVQGVRAGGGPMTWTVIGALTFVAMLVGLLLPVSAFFPKRNGS